MGKQAWIGVIGVYMGTCMPQIPFCDVICGSEVKRVWVAFLPSLSLSSTQCFFHVRPRKLQYTLIVNKVKKNPR